MEPEVIYLTPQEKLAILHSYLKGGFSPYFECPQLRQSLGCIPGQKLQKDGRFYYCSNCNRYLR